MPEPRVEKCSSVIADRQGKAERRPCPSPVPSCFAALAPNWRNSSNTACWSSGAMPTPVSLPDTSTNPSRGTAPTSIRPPSGVNLIALDSKLKTRPARDGPGETGQGCPSLLEEETSLTQTVCYSTPPATAAPRVDAGSVRRDPVTRRRYSSSPRGHHAERSR